MRIRLLQALALLATGLLAGAFGYGAANLVPTFNAVPLNMRLSFHAELMKMNGITMQAAMAVSTLSSLALALATLTRGRARLIAGAAGLLTLASFLITRLGNVPINGRIKEWALTSAPADHAEILRRWELFNNLRTLTALTAFALLITLALQGPGTDRKQPPRTARGRAGGAGGGLSGSRRDRVLERRKNEQSP
ncbi:anthrone oxygenase family protein [Streptomyces sp. NPDC058412]|uniref:anthrone oxygenase family protein n=1 Tax=Streptomyces sp. NPDC058412 TaxID=3346486 RepID=UPI00365872FA